MEPTQKTKLHRQRRAIDAVLSVADSLGLGIVQASIVKDSNNTLVELVNVETVAKVATSALPRRTRSLDIELDLLRHLAERGAPTVRPSSRIPPGPHVANGCRLILLDRLDHRPGASVEPHTAHATLRSVHDALRTYEGDLPSFMDALEDARGLLSEPRSVPDLLEDDRRFLLALHKMLGDELSGAAIQSRQALHGDPWEGGNLVRTPTGAAILDFEAACRGPREWDYTALSQAAAALDQTLDAELLSILSPLRSLCVSVWCWAQPGRSSEVDEAARWHLQRLQEDSPAS